MAKSEKDPVEKKSEPIVSERVLFAEKYRKSGYNVTVINGVLMFCGPYELEDISSMLGKDGYIGSFGVSEKVHKKVVEYTEE